MNRSVENFVQNVLSAYHIPLYRIADQETVVFDNQLRGVLFGEQCYESMFAYIRSFMSLRTACYWMDVYGCSYYLLNDAEDHSLVMIGPFFHQAVDDQTMTRNAQHAGIPKHLHRQYLSILHNIPVIPDFNFLSNFVNEYAHDLFQDQPYQWSELHEEQNPLETKSFRVEPSEPHFSIDVIEKRYAYMQKLLFYVGQGNAEKAVSYLIQFQSITEKPRLHNLLKDAHTWLITFNTSLRNTCENCGVHPFYVDEISTKWFYRIESLTNPNGRKDMMKEMVRDYTVFIASHRHTQYSELIEHAIIYIRMNLTQPLSLSLIADVLSVSSAYLSARFHQETNETITEYIHHTRVLATVDDLKNTNLSISMIGSNIGYDDTNYYIRQFKKYMSITPAQYRKQYRQSH